MKKFLFGSVPLNTNLAALLLRFILGGLFIYSGWLKIKDYDTILPMFTDIIGIGSKLSFNLLIFSEFFGGILIVLGLFTRLAVLPILFSMCIAYFIAHANDPFFKKELAFTFLVLCLPVFVMGSGKYSLDRLIFKK
jgi:putative oxidoreductase